MTKPLSPAAQSVMDAYNSGFDRPVAVHHKPRIAAALRAAALYCKKDQLQLLAIADELEGN